MIGLDPGGGANAGHRDTLTAVRTNDPSKRKVHIGFASLHHMEHLLRVLRTVAHSTLDRVVAGLGEPHAEVVRLSDAHALAGGSALLPWGQVVAVLGEAGPGRPTALAREASSLNASSSETFIRRTRYGCPAWRVNAGGFALPFRIVSSAGLVPGEEDQFRRGIPGPAAGPR